MIRGQMKGVWDEGGKTAKSFEDTEAKELEGMKA